jgi:hypothetical protein
VTPWQFELSGRPFSGDERDALAPDLDSLGADVSVLDVYDATLSVASRLTQPRVLRAYAGERMLGAAVVMLCRDGGSSFFSGSLARRAVHPLPPIWYWERSGLATDGHSGPGLVTAGVDRRELAGRAVSWLRRRHLVGSVVELSGAPALSGQVVTRGFGISQVDVSGGGAAPVLAEHRNLARKVRRFTGRGGRLDVRTGALPGWLAEPLVTAYAVARPINPPFVELYPQMVRAQWALTADRLVHVVAMIGDRPVGYHSFWRTGRRLALLSGAFGRPDDGNAHAYENVLLRSLDVAGELGCTLVDFGPTVNAVKRSLLGTRPTEMRFVSGVAPVRAAVRAMLPRSALSPDSIEAVVGPA